MVQSIDEIGISNENIMKQVDESNAQISEIVKVIADIGTKTKVINDIVFQTKLLSFNASVEAARAGEHGKGFAVVAEEVGNLAMMSGNAAKEINSMLDESARRVEAIVTETKTKVNHLIAQGKNKIDNGAHTARDCGAVLEQIVLGVESTVQMAKEISSASQEQDQGVREITKAMSQLEQVTQMNAASSQQASTSAEELSSHATSLKSLVHVLLEAVDGKEDSNSYSSGDGGPSSMRPTGQQKKLLPFKKSTRKLQGEVQVPSKLEAPSYDDSRFKDV
jgi:methyl-accepting chemotaxis protein